MLGQDFKLKKFAVSVEKYLALLNDELKRDENYEPGMKFVPHPNFAIRKTSLVYKFVPAHKRSIALKVVDKVSKKYTIKA